MATPTYTLIDSVTATGTTAGVTFSSIPTSYKHLVWTISGQNAASQTAVMSLNGSTSNFYRNYIYGRTTQLTGGREASGEMLWNGTFDPTSYFFYQGQIYDYRSNNYKTTLVSGGSYDFDTHVGLSTISWEVTSAITSVYLNMNGGTGTVYSLWGLVG